MAVLPQGPLPLGFRFHPTDEELVKYYLKGKINGQIDSEVVVIPEVDVCKCEPWDLPDKSVIRSDDPEWFFFSPRDRKYPNGYRSNRATKAGYWKATGKDRMIKTKPPGSTLIGTKKTLVFHRGRAPKGVRTNWIMHEYRTTEHELDSAEQGTFVLCRLFRKPEMKGPSSKVDGEYGNADDSGLSPTPTRSSLGETQQGADTLEEFATPLSHELPEPDMQENLHPLLNTSDTTSKGIERCLADEGDHATTYPSKPEGSHCNGNGASPIGDHEAQVGAEADCLLDELSWFLSPVHEQLDFGQLPHISSTVPLNMDYSVCDNVGQGSTMSQEDYAEQDSLNELLNSLLNNHEEDFPEVTDAQKDSVLRAVPDDQVSVLKEVSPKDSVSGKESGTGSDVDTIAVTMQEGLDMDTSGCFYGPAFLSSGSLQMNNANGCHETRPNQINLFPEKEQTGPTFRNQSFGQNIAVMASAADSWHHELSRNPRSIETGPSNNLFDSMKGQTGQTNVSGTGIKFRARRQLSDMDNLMAQQGLAHRRLQLQNLVHKESLLSTDGELSNVKDDNEVKSVITEAGECAEQQTVEDTETSVFLASPDDVQSTSDLDDTASTEAMTAFSEIFHESKSTLKQRTRGPRENCDKLEGVSLHLDTPRTVSLSINRVKVFVTAVLLLICVVIGWYLSS